MRLSFNKQRNNRRYNYTPRYYKGKEVTNPYAFENTFEGNGYIDIIKKNHFKKYGNLFGKKVLAFQTDFAYEIDNMNDYDYAKFEFARNKKRY